MVVSKLQIVAATVFGMAVALPAVANEDVIAHLSRNLAAETARLGEKTKECEQLKSRRPALAYDIGKLAELGLSRQQAMIAITYLGLRNDYLCDGDQRQRLAYALGLLENARQTYRVPDEKLGTIGAELVYPDTRYFEMGLAYHRLPKHVRDYLEEVAANLPFDAVRTINALPLY